MIESPPTKNRIALLIQYLGTDFHGWQRQAHGRTVQSEIEEAIAIIANHPVTIYGAGRTDAGVHASAQVAHFETNSPIPPESWAKVLNSYLKNDILIRASVQVSDDWHACFSAIWRRYRYTIYTAKTANIFLKNLSWHYYHTPLKENLMTDAITSLLGKNDLSAFRRAGSNRPHSYVEVQEVQCDRQGDFIYIEIQAKGFLYGMVRLLVGMLVEVGTERRSPESFKEIWVNKKRDQVKYSAPAKGLCLLRVGYPKIPFAQSIWFDSQPIFSFN